VSGKHIGASQLIEADSQHFYETMADACSVYRFNSYEYRCRLRIPRPKGSLDVGDRVSVAEYLQGFPERQVWVYPPTSGQFVFLGFADGLCRASC
jgi:hypothetical protein